MAPPKPYSIVDDEDNIKRFQEVMRREEAARRALSASQRLAKQMESKVEHDLAGDTTRPSTQAGNVEGGQSSTLQPTPNANVPGGPPPTVGFNSVQSPPVSGVRPPPPTPEVPASPPPESVPNVSPTNIGRILSDVIDSLPKGMTFSLGESMFKPGSKRNLLYLEELAKERASSSKKLVAGDTNKPMSPDERQQRNASFKRMSFEVAESTSTPGSPGPATDSPRRTLIGPSLYSRGRPEPQAYRPAPAAKCPTLPSPQKTSQATYIPPHLQPVPPHLRENTQSNTAKAVISDPSQSAKLLDNDVKPNDPVAYPGLASAAVKINVENTVADPLSLEKIKYEADLQSPELPSVKASPVSNVHASPITNPGTSVGPNAASPEAPADAVEASSADGALCPATPKSEERSCAMIGGRKAIIVNLPLDVNPSLVTSIVFGGPLEKIEIIQQTAHVLFLYAQDCQNYLNSTVNGVIFGHGGCRYLASVIASPEMNTTSGQVVAYMNKDITRCIRAIGVDECMTIERMREKAAYKNRDVDDIIVETTATGLRVVVFRFCDIRHAVQFKTAIEREEEWEHCYVHYSPDPCARIPAS